MEPPLLLVSGCFCGVDPGRAVIAPGALGERPVLVRERVRGGRRSRGRVLVTLPVGQEPAGHSWCCSADGFGVTLRLALISVIGI